MISESVFTYLLSNSFDEEYPVHREIKNTKYRINLSENTHCMFAEDKDTQIILIGLCVDSKGEIERDDIPSRLLKSAMLGIGELTGYAGRFAGNYVIIAIIHNSIYAFTDAIGCLQLNYSISNDFICCASHDGLIARHMGYEPSEYWTSIRKSSPLFKQLPYNMTIYNDIKQLLPNHYLDFNNKKPARYYPDNQGIIKKFDIEAASEFTIQRTNNIITEYSKYYKTVPSLTAGWDSRVLFALFRNCGMPAEVFTMLHSNLTESDADIFILKIA